MIALLRCRMSDVADDVTTIKEQLKAVMTELQDR
eukprot:COSAG06_NODE_41673_length_389_cov_0.565517_1_plen_33_part_10